MDALTPDIRISKSGRSHSPLQNPMPKMANKPWNAATYVYTIFRIFRKLSYCVCHPFCVKHIFVVSIKPIIFYLFDVFVQQKRIKKKKKVSDEFFVITTLLF